MYCQKFQSRKSINPYVRRLYELNE